MFEKEILFNKMQGNLRWYLFDFIYKVKLVIRNIYFLIRKISSGNYGK